MTVGLKSVAVCLAFIFFQSMFANLRWQVRNETPRKKKEREESTNEPFVVLDVLGAVFQVAIAASEIGRQQSLAQILCL